MGLSACLPGAGLVQLLPFDYLNCEIDKQPAKAVS